MSQDFTDRTVDRIADAVYESERNRGIQGIPVLGPPAWRDYQNDDGLELFKLKQALTPGGAADAYPYQFSASSGSYAVDSNAGDVVKVKDTIGNFCGGVGDLVLCRFVGNSDSSTNREVLAVLPSAPALCFGQTKAAVAATDGTFAIDHITAASAGWLPTTNSSDSMTISNWAGWSCSTSGVSVMFAVLDCNSATGVVGHGNFVQGPCGA